ncbi:MAG: hypothetical protein AAGM21_05315 [Pseudomonadota bacterium]
MNSAFFTLHTGLLREGSIADDQTIKHETGYLLAVVRPDGG